MTTIEDSQGQTRAKLHWGVAEVGALVAILATLGGGLGVAIKVAIAQDRTERTANEAKITADKAAEEVGGIKERLSRIEERVQRLPRIEEKLDALVQRGVR